MPTQKELESLWATGSIIGQPTAASVTPQPAMQPQKDLEALWQTGELAEEQDMAAMEPIAPESITTEPPGEPISGAEAFGMGARQGATLGFADESKAFMGAALDYMTGQTDSFIEDYQSLRGIYRKEEQQARKAHPGMYVAGEITGGVASGGVAGVGRTVAGTAARQAAAGGLGGFGISEGGLAEQTVGAAIGATAGATLATASSLVGTGAKKVWQRYTGKMPPESFFDDTGALTAEGREALAKRGITEAEVTDEALKIMRESPRGGTAAEQLREAESRSAGVRLTRGETEQNMDRLSFERETAKLDAGEPIREFKAQQAADLKASLENMADEFSPFSLSRREAGDTVQDTLKTLKDQDKEITRNLYNAARVQMGDSHPIGTESIRNVFDQMEDRYEGLVAEIPAIRKSLEKFNVIGKKGKPLHAGNAEELRQRFNDAWDPIDGRNHIVVGKLKKALDDELDKIADVANVEDFKKARFSAKKDKDTWEAKDILENISSFKRGTDTLKVAPELVVEKIMKGPQAPTNIVAVKNILLRDGGTKESRETWNTIKRYTVDDLLAKSFKSKAATEEGGQIAFSPSAFDSALERIGADGLKELFTPAELKKIREFQRVAGDATRTIKGAENFSNHAPFWKKLKDMSVMTALPVGVAADLAYQAPIFTTALAMKGAQAGMRKRKVRKTLEKPRLTAQMRKGKVKMVTDPLFRRLATNPALSMELVRAAEE